MELSLDYAGRRHGDIELEVGATDRTGSPVAGPTGATRLHGATGRPTVASRMSDDWRYAQRRPSSLRPDPADRPRPRHDGLPGARQTRQCWGQFDPTAMGSYRRNTGTTGSWADRSHESYRLHRAWR